MSDSVTVRAATGCGGGDRPVEASEELQRLDADLAAGRVDATSYRRRRDVLIARRREEAARVAAEETTTTAEESSRRAPQPPTAEDPVTGPPVTEKADPVPAVDPLPAVPAVDPLPAAPSVASPIPAVPVVDPIPAVPSVASRPAPTGRPAPRVASEGRPAPPIAGEGRPRPTYPSDGALRSAAEADTTAGEGRRRPTYPTDGALRPGGEQTDAFPTPTPSPADPFPPPFRWGPAPGTPDADATQVVHDPADTTQVVPPSTFQPPTFAVPERTQVVPGVPAGRRPSAPVPASRTTPPWVDRPPERQDPPSGIAGSDVFYGGRRGLASTLGTIAVVVVVILILVLSFSLG